MKKQVKKVKKHVNKFLGDHEKVASGLKSLNKLAKKATGGDRLPGWAKGLTGIGVTGVGFLAWLFLF